jgi:hypothetical protein
MLPHDPIRHDPAASPIAAAKRKGQVDGNQHRATAADA